MFKGTNKFWKGLALLLVLCMLPTVAFAEGDTPETKVIVTATDNSVVDGDAVKVTASVEAEGDITILALRGGEGFAEGTTSSEATTDASDYLTGLPVDSAEASTVTLKNSVVYIDQETAVLNSDTGKYEVTFEFIPRSNGVTARGGYINIFFGGENVNTLAVLTVEKLERAPELGKMDWFLGEALTFDVTNLKSGTAMEAEKRTAWVTGATAVVSFTDDSIEDEEIALTADNITLVDDQYILSLGTTLEGKEIKSVKITDANSEFDPAEYTQTLKQSPKFAGTLSAEGIVSGDLLTITATEKEGSTHNWLGALGEAKYYYKAKGAEDNAYVEIAGALSSNTITIAADVLPLVAKGANEYTFKAEVENYETATFDVTITSPTTKAAGEIANAVKALKAENSDPAAYYEDEMNADDSIPTGLEDQMYGRRYVDVSEITVGHGTSIAWTWAPELTEVEGKPGVYELARNADNDATYTLTATISKGTDYTAETLTTSFTVGQLGVAGVDITIDPTAKFPAADAAKDATVTLKKGDTTVATADYATGFKFTAVTADTYTVIITRSGYVTASVEVAVTQDGLPNDFAVPAMIAGDLDPDGDVDLDDYAAFGAKYGKNKVEHPTDFNPASDFDGDNDTDLDDYAIFGSNYGYPNN